MAKSYALYGLLLLALLNVSHAQYSHREHQQWRFQACNIRQINAAEPRNRVESEAGVTEFWDANEQQFECAGVAPLRHVIQPRGLLLPSYSNGPKLVYVQRGKGIHSAALPGCPETYQPSDYESLRGQKGSMDQHQKVRRVQDGDIVAIPAGIADWFYNDGNEELVLLMIFDTSNYDNQLDKDLRKFFMAGNPREFQSRLRRGRESEREYSGNVLSGLDEDIVAEIFNIDTDLARRLTNPSMQRGVIISVNEEQELKSLIPRVHPEEEYRRESRYINGFEETLCSARLSHNINDPLRADLYNPRAGRITNVNSLNLPILKLLRLSAQKGVLYKNGMMTPHWNFNAHSVFFIERGSGRIQIVSDEGKKVFDGNVRVGQMLTAPQNYVIVKMAGSEGLEWVSFKTNDNAKINQLAGRVSTMRAIPDAVVANAYQISTEEARRIKYNRKEVTLLSPGRSSEFRMD